MTTTVIDTDSTFGNRFAQLIRKQSRRNAKHNRTRASLFASNLCVCVCDFLLQFVDNKPNRSEIIMQLNVVWLLLLLVFVDIRAFCNWSDDVRLSCERMDCVNVGVIHEIDGVVGIHNFNECI